MSEHTDAQITAVRDALAEALGDAYDCVRVWSAWGYGTMGPNDFMLVAEDGERMHELAVAALDASGVVDLIEALQLMLKQFTKTPSSLADSEARRKAHAAIRKALGE